MPIRPYSLGKHAGSWVITEGFALDSSLRNGKKCQGSIQYDDKGTATCGHGGNDADMWIDM